MLTYLKGCFPELKYNKNINPNNCYIVFHDNTYNFKDKKYKRDVIGVITYNEELNTYLFVDTHFSLKSETMIKIGTKMEELNNKIKLTEKEMVKEAEEN